MIVSKIFLVFGDIDSLEENSLEARYFGYPAIEICLMLFHDQTGVMGFGEGVQCKVLILSHCNKGTCHRHELLLWLTLITWLNSICQVSPL